MKPKKMPKDAVKPALVPSQASQPEREDEDTEAVPPGVESAELEEEEKTRERAADDGMPDEDTL